VIVFSVVSTESPSSAHEAICTGNGNAQPPSSSALATSKHLLNMNPPGDIPDAGLLGRPAEHAYNGSLFIFVKGVIAKYGCQGDGLTTTIARQLARAPRFLWISSRLFRVTQR